MRGLVELHVLPFTMSLGEHLALVSGQSITMSGEQSAIGLFTEML